MKKILYITYDGITDPLGQSQVLPYLKGLSVNGYGIHILSFEKKNTFLRQKDTVNEIMRESNITWHYRFFTSRPKYISKFYDLVQLKKTAGKLQQEFGFYAVHCRSYISAQAGLLLKKKYGTKFIFDMRGFWIDERIDNGQWKQSNFFFRLLIKRYREKEKDFYKNADAIISLTQKAKDYMVSHAGVDERKINVIPCCVDMHLFNSKNIDSKKADEISKDLCLNEKDYLIVYSGSLGALYLIEETVAFFKALKAKIPEAKLLILSKITAGQLMPYLKKNELGQNDVMLRWSSRLDMPYYLSLSKAALCFIRPDFSKMASCPTKLAEYLAMGIPVVVNAGIGDDDEIIRSGNCGIVLQSFAENDIEKGISEMKKFIAPYQGAVECADKYYSLDKGISKYLSVYKSI